MFNRCFQKTVVLASLLVLSGGCVSKSWPLEDNEPHSYLLDADWRQRIVHEKYDRSRLQKLAGKPTIDDSEEWVYVSKFNHNVYVAVGELVPAYDSGLNPCWKTTVVTFNEAGTVSRIETGTTPSQIAESAGCWTCLGIDLNKNVRVRKVPATQASTSRPSNAVVPATTRAAPAGH